MLSKDVCKKCITRASATLYVKGWAAIDDEKWEKGYVYCPHVFAVTLRKNKAPPTWCAFAFEHAVAAGVKDAE